MVKKDIVIFGAGGFGREVMWLLEENNSDIETWNILGFVDDTPNFKGKVVNGFPIVGNTDWLIEYGKELSVVCCIGNSKDRQSVIKKLQNNKNLKFPNIISKDARVSRLVSFGQGCIICGGSTLTVNIRLGDFLIVNLNCTVGHDAVLNKFVTLNPSVNVSGYVQIGNCSEIGTGSQIIQHTQIGCNTIVGAGAVVVKDLPSNCTAVGGPAKPIKYFKEV
ncbi:acetyltransferase [Clostridium estertheticum]|nr:acetyltransferase [Clostridium estertheticum]